MDRKRPKELFAFRVGGDVRPETLPANQLADLIRDVEAAVRAVAEDARGGGPLPPGFLLALIGVTERGSTDLEFYCPDVQLGGQATDDLSQAIKTNNIGSLPQTAQTAVARLSAYSRNSGRTLEFRRDKKILAVILPAPEPAEVLEVKGGASLFGRVERAGGASPKIVLRLRSDEVEHCAVSQDLAKQVGHRLYEWVVLEGTATWDAETGERMHFQAERLGEYKYVPLNQAFAELRQALGSSP